MADDGRLYDFGDYPNISAYAVADLHFMQTDFRIILFDWFKVDGIWQRRVVGTVKRPTCTLTDQQRVQWQEAAQARPPAAQGLALH